jgi:hypothetical protein
LLDLQKRARDRGPDGEDQNQSLSNKPKSDYDDSFEKYSDDEFESDDDKKDIKKALKHENRKALKFQAKAGVNTKQNLQINNLRPALNGSNGASKPNLSPSHSPNREATPETGFAKSRGLVVNKKKVDLGAANKQFERIEALKEILQIDFEEFDNQLNIKPQTKQDLYFNRLQTFQIHNEMVQSNDNYISKDIQTDDIEEKNVAAQYPEDFSAKSFEGGAPKSHDLAGFIRRVAPVVERVLEENILLADLANPKAKDKNPVEEKAKISCPSDLQKLLGCKVSYMSWVHTFETAPHRKCAVSYVLESKEEEQTYITIVYHLSSASPIKFLKTFDEVTWMAAPFENILICGTKLGSIWLFDLDENLVLKGDISNEEPGLGEKVIKDFEMEALKRIYQVMDPTYSTDGLDDMVHFNEITKLVSLVKKGSYRIVSLDAVGTLSSWIVIEYSEGDIAGSLADLTLKVGGKIKLALHGSVDLSDKLNIVYDSQTFEIDFDPKNQNTFVFSTSEGMFYSKLYNQSNDSTSVKGGPVIRKLDTSSVGELIRVTSISYSDQGFILAGFEDGSIGLYHIDFSSPLSIWYNAWETAVKTIKWWTIYFTEGKVKPTILNDK